MLREVTAAGSSTTDTYRSYSLDCSGMMDWIFYNITGGEYILGRGGGATAQHSYCMPVFQAEAQPGDPAFYPYDSHVGIVVGWRGWETADLPLFQRTKQCGGDGVRRQRLYHPGAAGYFPVNSRNSPQFEGSFDRFLRFSL